MIEADHDDALAWRLEEACANAYPCWRDLRLHGWSLRADGGHTRRNNSINPLGSGAADPSDIVEFASGIYRRLRKPVLFRIPAMLATADDRLDRLGFTAEGETVTIMGQPTQAPQRPAAGVTLDGDGGQGWLAAWRELRPDVDPSPQGRALEALVLPSCFAAFRSDGRAVAVAYAAIDRGIAVIESVFTHPEHRGRGHARATLRALIADCTRLGAEAFSLQVQADNEPARALYASLGLRDEIYRYWYRRAPQAD
jgi:N-acetylglutamate synthase